MTKRKYEGVKCGAKTRQTEGTCKRPAGWGTDHPGEGRCKLHAGSSPTKSGRYSVIKRRRIAELLEHFRQDTDPLNVSEELHLLRSLVLDFIERYDENTEALIAWHNSYGPAYEEAVKLWRDEYSDWREKMTDIYESGGWQDVEAEDLPPPPEPPDPYEHQNKPRQVLDILSAGKFVVQIGTLVERVDKARKEGGVSLEVLDKYLENLGSEVVNASREVIDDPTIRSALLASITKRWQIVKLADHSPATGEGYTEGARAVN